METLESVSKSLLILNRGIMQRQGLSSVMTRTDTLNELTVISLKHAGERLRWISICTIGWLHVSVCIKPAQIYIDVQYMRVWHTTKKSVTPQKKITLPTKQMRDVPWGVLKKNNPPEEMFNNTVKQMKAGILPCSLGCFINSFIISFFLFVLKYTLLPALVCFPPACCLSCPKIFSPAPHYPSLPGCFS